MIKTLYRLQKCLDLSAQISLFFMQLSMKDLLKRVFIKNIPFFSFANVV